MAWTTLERGRGLRDRQADAPVPSQLPLLAPAQSALLRQWARADAARRGRTALLKEAGPAAIELAEALCERLLEDGWIVRRERLAGGAWHWDSIAWRDLPQLQALLGLAGAGQREAQRRAQIEQARAWLQARREAPAGTALDPDLLDELAQVLAALATERTLRNDQLAGRLALMRAVADWRDAGLQGTRREFALRARDATKALSAADWKWLESAFDLDRLRIARFAQVLWLAGELALRWDAGTTVVAPLHFAGLPLADVARAQPVSAPARWWLIENRASFERQAGERAPGTVLVWMPGRPSTAWLDAVGHLLDRAPAPAWISADADPAGVDIARSVGALWSARGLAWAPHRMGVAEWSATTQHWPLNEHDHRLLATLLSDPTLPDGLRLLCERMREEGRKAEQEGWM